MLIMHRGRSLTHDRSAVLISDSSGRASNATFAESDVTPLLLYSCGAPLAKNMNVDLVRANIPRERLAQMPIRFVRAYTQTPASEPARVDDFNDLLIEQMKSLGYLQ